MNLEVAMQLNTHVRFVKRQGMDEGRCQVVDYANTYKKGCPTAGWSTDFQ
jgi:hypothetical protein